jgi:hypothetical protein
MIAPIYKYIFKLSLNNVTLLTIIIFLFSNRVWKVEILIFFLDSFDDIRVYEKQTFKMLENRFSPRCNRLSNMCNRLQVQFFKYFWTLKRCNGLQKRNNRLPPVKCIFPWNVQFKWLVMVHGTPLNGCTFCFMDIFYSL